MRLSIAALVVSALLVGTANAAPPEAPPSPKHHVVTCDQARPGSKLWKQCHPKKAPKIVRQPKVSHKLAPARQPAPMDEPAPRP